MKIRIPTVTKLAVIAAVLTLGCAPAALAQSQGQLESQRAPAQRAAPEDTHKTQGQFGAPEKGVGEQHGGPPGDRLTRPADPNRTPPPGAQTDPMRPSEQGGSTAATSAKPAETLTGARERPQSAEQPRDSGTTDEIYSVNPKEDRSPTKPAAGAPNPKPDPSR